MADSRPVTVWADNTPLTEKQLRELAEKIPEWKKLAAKLGFSATEITQIEKDHRFEPFEENVFQMLLKWKRRKGNAAKLKELCEALKQAGLQVLHDELLAIPSTSSSGSQTATTTSASTASATPSASSGSRETTRNACGICYEREIDTYFHPCGDTLCAFCAAQYPAGNADSTCPFCRRQVVEVNPLYPRNT